LTLSGNAAAVNTLLAGLTYAPSAEYEGADTLHLSATSSDGSNTYPSPATASTAITVNPVAEPPTASAPATATTAVNTAIDIGGIVVGPAAEDADDTVSVLLSVAHGTLAVSPMAGVTESANGQGSLTVSGSASNVNAALASLVYTPTASFTGTDTLNVSVTSRDGSDTYPTQATAATAISVTLNSEFLIVGGPGPTLDWNDAANWSGGVVPTLSINATINAPANYTVVIKGTPDAQAASLTIPHGAASTDITVSGTLQLAGDLDISDSGKLENDGTLEQTTSASFIGPIINDGTIILDPNIFLDVTGTITGIGKFWIDSGSTLEFTPGSKVAPGTTDSQIIYFEQGAGKLIIDDWGKFDGVITGTDIGTHLTPTDLIDLTQLPFVGGSMSVSVTYNSGTNISTLIFSDGISANNVTLHFSGNYIGTVWSFTSINGGAGTEIHDPPAVDGAVMVDGGTTDEVTATSASNIAIAFGADTSLTLNNSQNFTGQIAGLAGSGTAPTLPPSQTLPRSPTTGAGGSGIAPMTTPTVWASTLEKNSNPAKTLGTGDTLTKFINARVANDTINASNENGIVFSVFGADLLAGAHLTAKHSNAQFCSIRDFVPGSDKIDLTAFGTFASAILALTPTDTSVPAHSIASLHEGKANEMIVYVNPTDQPLRVGDSGLMEIHLQGITAIQSSDFVLAPITTAATMAETLVAVGDLGDPATMTQNDATIIAASGGDISSDTTLRGSALFADSDSMAHLTKIGESSDFARDQLNSIDSPKLASFDQGGMVSTGDCTDGTVTALPNGVSIELPAVAATATMQTTAFNQNPVFGSAGAMKVDGAVMYGPTLQGSDQVVPSGSTWTIIPEESKNEGHGASVPKDPTKAGETHAHGIDDPDAAPDSGNPKTPGGGDGNRSLASEAGEHGTPVHGASAHDFEPSSIAQIVSGETVGTPGDSFHFKSEISDTKGLHVAGVGEPNDASASKGHHENAAASNGPPAISDDDAGITGTMGDSFHFKDQIPGSKSSGGNDLAELDQNPTSMGHHNDAVGTPAAPTIPDGAQMTELASPADDPFNMVAHQGSNAHVTHVQHDLMV
jgi:hypothetical protein